MMWCSMRYSVRDQLCYATREMSHSPLVASKPKNVAAAAGTARNRLGARPRYSAFLHHQRILPGCLECRTADQSVPSLTDPSAQRNKTYTPPSRMTALSSLAMYPPLAHPPRAGGASASCTRLLTTSKG